MPYPPKDTTNTERLLDEGKAHLEAGRLGKAEACFRAVAKASDLPPARNNWAFCRFKRGDYAGALEVLQPLLHGVVPAPYSRALASLSCSALGERGKARQHLEQAVRDLDAVLGVQAHPWGAAEPAWVEYSVVVAEAAIKLGDYRMVLGLHSRWPGREFANRGFLAGIAAFNLGRFERAAKYWQKVTDPKWVRALSAFILVANLAQQGLVPPFPLESDSADTRQVRDEASLSALIRTSGAARVPILAALFGGVPYLPTGALRQLIAQTEDWGLELGRRVLKGSVALNLKMEAAHALVDRGVYAVGEPIPAIHEGRATTLVVSQVELRQRDPELERIVAEAQRLRDSGERDEAYRLLEKLELEGVAYPPAMLTLANLRRDRGKLEEARVTLEALEDAFPDDPTVLFNLAGLYLQKGDLLRAHEYATRVNPKGQSPELRERLEALKRHLTSLRWPDPDAAADSWRRKEEEKPVSPEVTLQKALKGIPAPWLNAAAAAHGIGSVPRRGEREQLLAEALQNTPHLRQVLASQSPGVRSALRFLLEKGGWCKLSVLTRRFGPLDGDGYWWNEKPPASTVGQLRVLALVFVGRTQIEGKAHKVAVVPVELRPLLGRCL
ncbi:MAG: tetratricopeptide repeat protein [Chitinophagales bacterium]